MANLTRFLRGTLWVLAWLLALLCTLWTFGALHFDASFGSILSIFLALGLLAALLLVPGQRNKLLSVFGAFLLVWLWWITQKPTNDADWQPEVSKTAWAEINGDEVTLHNVRNFDYRSKTDFTPRWETRTVRLSQITGLDLAINYWGSPWIAHPILSFQFSDAPPIAFSIETRKKKGQTYSAIGGLYRQYELIYIVADERDVFRVRTNYNGETLYLYRGTLSLEEARARFLEYVAALNSLHHTPKWYNAITTNCTTSIRTQRSAEQRAPWDWRLLLNGKSDELLYERKAIITSGLPFPELKERSLINKVANAADKDPNFSQTIRQDLPGFSKP